MVMNTNSKRESGRKAQLTNIQAAKVQPLQGRLGLLSFSFLTYAGCIRDSHFNLGTSGYVEDVVGSYGRYRDDE